MVLRLCSFKLTRPSGDVICQYDLDGSGKIGHAAIFIDATTVIDSTKDKTVGKRKVGASSWYRARIALGVRIIVCGAGLAHSSLKCAGLPMVSRSFSISAMNSS